MLTVIKMHNTEVVSVDLIRSIDSITTSNVVKVYSNNQYYEYDTGYLTLEQVERLSFSTGGANVGMIVSEDEIYVGSMNGYSLRGFVRDNWGKENA